MVAGTQHLAQEAAIPCNLDIDTESLTGSDNTKNGRRRRI